MSKLTFVVLALLVAAVIATEIDSEKRDSDCHPQCRWQCDDPTCPAKCHPVCERPKCQIQCEETACARCKVHCDKPKCNVRCPKKMCESKNCPKCETVCSPANCRTSCIAPEPVCTPMCEQTKCDWKCKKPTTCPRPKCELQCDKPACEAKKPKRHHRRSGCCKCSDRNIKASVVAAGTTGFSETAGHVLPSFMEVYHTIKFHEKNGAEGCCECA